MFSGDNDCCFVVVIIFGEVMYGLKQLLVCLRCVKECEVVFLDIILVVCLQGVGGDYGEIIVVFFQGVEKVCIFVFRGNCDGFIGKDYFKFIY